MNRRVLLGNAGLGLVVCFFVFALLSRALYAQAGPAQNVEQMAKQLNLTPQQKLELVPILKAEAPRVEAIRNDPSLSRAQKLQKLRAIHEETNPRVKSILTPEQYQQLQEIRRTEIGQAVRRRYGQ
jgi:Spy/CpxP family protein refolding chaperone